MKNGKRTLAPAEQKELLQTLKTRFEKNMHRHKGLEWAKIEERLLANNEHLWSLNQMENSGGEPDVVILSTHSKILKVGEYLFCDCAPESPKGRRSICYDHEALEARKEHKPENSAVQMAADMGVEILTEAEYRALQELGNFDTKTSSWVKTPAAIRQLGGAIFCDRRYNHVFMYHNGAESYYAARGFRGWLKV